MWILKLEVLLATISTEVLQVDGRLRRGDHTSSATFAHNTLEQDQLGQAAMQIRNDLSYLSTNLKRPWPMYYLRFVDVGTWLRLAVWRNSQPKLIRNRWHCISRRTICLITGRMLYLGRVRVNALLSEQCFIVSESLGQNLFIGPSVPVSRWMRRIEDTFYAMPQYMRRRVPFDRIFRTGSATRREQPYYTRYETAGD